MSQQEKADHEIRFPVGSCVSYRADGICDIVDIRFESFSKGGNEMEYYVLAPRNDPNCRTFVPVKNPKLTAMMRLLPTPEDIYTLTRELSGQTLTWISDPHQRNNACKKILARGDRREIILLIHTVRAHVRQTLDAGKKASITDESVLRQACRILKNEFSAVLNISSDEELYRLLDAGNQ